MTRILATISLALTACGGAAFTSVVDDDASPPSIEAADRADLDSASAQPAPVDARRLGDEWEPAAVRDSGSGSADSRESAASASPTDGRADSSSADDAGDAGPKRCCAIGSGVGMEWVPCSPVSCMGPAGYACGAGNAVGVIEACP